MKVPILLQATRRPEAGVKTSYILVHPAWKWPGGEEIRIRSLSFCQIWACAAVLRCGRTVWWQFNKLKPFTITLCFETICPLCPVLQFLSPLIPELYFTRRASTTPALFQRKQSFLQRSSRASDTGQPLDLMAMNVPLMIKMKGRKRRLTVIVKSGIIWWYAYGCWLKKTVFRIM